MLCQKTEFVPGSSSSSRQMEQTTRTEADRPEEYIALVVEDSLLVAMAIEDALIEKGMTVLVATSVAAAEEMIAAQTPNVAFLDLHLPDGLSLDLALSLRDMGCAVAISSGLDSDSVPDSHAFAIQFRKPSSPDLLADWAVTALRSENQAKAGNAVTISSCSHPGTG